MEYRALGERTGLAVSVIGFGGAPIGLSGYLTKEDRDSPAVQAQAIAAIREAVERGINFFDTAPGYGDGRSERIFGEALAPVRDQVILATKYAVGADWSPERATLGLKESLTRLRTDRVDLLQHHGGTYSDELAESILSRGVLDWADAMRSEGLCRFTGITAEGPSGGLERLLRTGRFDVIEVLYNMLYQATCDHQREPAGIVPLAKSLGMGVTVMRPATSGLLPRLIAAEFPDLDPARLIRLALRFVISTPEIDCAVVGMRTIEEVRENAALADDPAARLDLRALHDRYA